MKFWVWIIFLFVLISPHFGFTQDEFTEVKGLPTKEVFDLHVDKKGFLWVGHNLGISRYDGVSFTHFTHPLQTSLSMTDILEDEYGRIWCHNFTGQIFYIREEKMNLLESYEYSKEPEFPRMVIHDDELVVTSRIKGLFACDLKTLNGRYVPLKNAGAYKTVSITVVNSTVIANNNGKWYQYDKKAGVRPLMDVSKDKVLATSGSYFLNSASHQDTAYYILNPAGMVCKVLYKDGAINVVRKEYYNSFINTLSLVKNDLWINTRDKSVSPDASEFIPIDNVSDLVVDHYGNKWISTLDKGLFANHRTPTWQKVNTPGVKSGELLKHIIFYKNLLVGGTTNGEVIFQDTTTKEIVWKYKFSEEEGSVDFLKFIGNEEFFVSTSAKSFLINFRTHHLTKVIDASARDLDVRNNIYAVATPVGTYLMPRYGETVFNKKIVDSLLVSFPQFEMYNFCVFNNSRGKAIRYDTQSDNIFITMRGVLYSSGKAGTLPVLYNKRPIYTSALEMVQTKLYIGSFNGLLIRENHAFSRFGVEDGLLSNIILSFKRTNSHLWLFLSNAVQVFDLQKNRIINEIDLPKVAGPDVFDVIEDGRYAYLTSQEGLYKISLGNASGLNFETSLRYTLVNNIDTVTATSFQLPYFKNDIQFNLAIPVYHTTSTYFKYRLNEEGTDNDWSSTKELERSVRFASLMPGDYTFEAYAVVGGIQEKTPLVVHFTINKPWWKQNWFILLSVAVLVGGFYLLYHLRLQQIIKVEKIRRNISHDLHDEIGSTLSSINIYSELAKKEKENEEYIVLIQNNVKEVITKLDDLVWSINPKNDSFAQLISRMQLFAEPLMANSHIAYSFERSEELLNMNLSVELKRNLYLLFKEIINNVAKHSNAQKCVVRIAYKTSNVMLEVKDDGIGFDQSVYKKGRTGLNSLFERTTQMKGKLKIRSAIGKGTNITVIVPIT